MASPIPVESATPLEAAAQTPEWHRFARYAAALALAAGVVVAFVFIEPVATIIVVGALIAVVTGFAARWLTRRTGMRFTLAVIIVYALVIVGIILLAVTVFPWVIRALEVLLTALRTTPPQLGAAIDAQTLAQTSVVGQKLALVFTAEQVVRFAEGVINWVTGFLVSIARLMGRAVYVGTLGLFLSFLIHLDLGERGLRAVDRLPAGHQREVRLLWRRLVPLWTRFVGASLIFAGLIAVGSLIEYVILGVPYPVLMALLTGLITPIPSIGGILSSFVVAVPCLLLGSTRFTEMSPLVFAGLVWGINALITQVAYNFVLMPILGKAVRLPVSVVLVGVLASFALNSILFAFLVVPVVASVRVLAQYLVAKIQRREPFPDEPMTAMPAAHPTPGYGGLSV